MKMSVLEKVEIFVVLLLSLNFLMDSILISSTKCLVLRTNHFLEFFGTQFPNGFHLDS